MVDLLKTINFGAPSQDTTNFKSLISNTYPDIEKKVKQTPFNNGVALTILTQVEHLGAIIDLIDVRIEPGAKVGAHIHEKGGEIEFPLTPILSIMGDALKDDNGYVLDENGNIKHAITEQKIIMPGVPSPIPETVVHEYRNPMSDSYADILFFIPHTHATAEDKKLAISPEITIPNLTELINTFLKEQGEK